MKDLIKTMAKDIAGLNQMMANYQKRHDAVKGKNLHIVKVNPVYTVSLDAKGYTQLGRLVEAALFTYAEASRVIKEVKFKNPDGTEVKAEGIFEAADFFEEQVIDVQQTIVQMEKAIELLKSKEN